MADIMTFPNTWEEYEEIYGLTDTEQIYTNGSRLIPSFRVKQWLEHLKSEQNEAPIITCFGICTDECEGYQDGKCVLNAKKIEPDCNWK